jgi:hypothetical protein|nr:MAG TPA: hypothetical protein [Caudoviricetes sp.]
MGRPRKTDIQKKSILADDENIKGVTSSGFNFTVSKDHLDDAELMEALVEADDKGEQYIVKAVKCLLGAEQKKELYDHCRNEKGIVPYSKVCAELVEIFNICGDRLKK